MGSPVYTKRRSDAPGYRSLADVALDLRWSWNHAADELWKWLDPDLWESTHNPWFVLQTVSHERLREVTSDPGFRKLADELAEERRAVAGYPRWFQQTYPDSPLNEVAYFSMEFMLSEALPIYSGGLGNVAGDQLKTASDLGVPLIGVGLLYQQGYFRQEIDAQGRQEALFPFNDPHQLPIQLVCEPNHEALRFAIDFPGGDLWIRAWQVQVGRTWLFLLDTNDPANLPAHRGIAGELYGGGPELRLKQEIVLGIGGWRLLHALGFRPEVCHLNEGHAAFAVLERARCYMADNRQPFQLALTVTRAGNLFTTHTSVEAGFDRFAPALLERYLKGYAEKHLGISFPEFLALGRRHRDNSSEPFNMAYLALRGSGAVNGVSRLHGEVSRRIFETLFPRWPEAEIPVTHVTNGVHMPTWDSAEADRLWETVCGKQRWLGELESVQRNLSRVSDTALWQLRLDSRTALVEYVRRRLQRQLAGHGASLEEVTQAAQVLDPNRLTLGFARRFAIYKRPNLLLHDPDRLIRILTNSGRPVQLILAGKAHPEDEPGQAMIEQWVRFVRRPEVRPHAVFLGDYDMLMAEKLVQGVDVWLNTPRRPWEASGTSGMKTLVNGGLNLSELDGWWAEAYSPPLGWALGDGQEHGEDASWDAREAEELYSLLEREVIPEFYARDEKGVPRGWVARIRESMGVLTPAFSANRALREYTERLYAPAAAAYCGRAAEGGRLGAELLRWQQETASHWPSLRFGSATWEQQGDEYLFRVELQVGELDPQGMQVELYAEDKPRERPFRQRLERAEPMAQPVKGFAYTGRVPANRPATDYAVRVIPHHAAASIPLEAPWILWRD